MTYKSAILLVVMALSVLALGACSSSKGSSAAPKESPRDMTQETPSEGALSLRLGKFSVYPHLSEPEILAVTRAPAMSY